MLGGFNQAREAEHNLRGGSEYGEAWHRAGMLEKKQNVFDDFIAAAEWLTEQGYTRPGRLGIMGGSNGGLLTGAALVQHPELFGVEGDRLIEHGEGVAAFARYRAQAKAAQTQGATGNG